MPHNILIADDHPLFRTAMKAILNKTLGKTNTVDVGSISALQEVLDNGFRPNLILLDLKMPGAYGISALLYLKGKFPDVTVAIVSATDHMGMIHEAFKHGADGYIPKSLSMSELEDAINALLKYGTWKPDYFQADTPLQIEKDSIENKISILTPQQFRVLGLLGEGMLNKQIAYEINISEATVKAHITAILKKLGVVSRVQAVLKLRELNKIDAPTNSKNKKHSSYTTRYK